MKISQILGTGAKKSNFNLEKSFIVYSENYEKPSKERFRDEDHILRYYNDKSILKNNNIVLVFVYSDPSKTPEVHFKADDLLLVSEYIPSIKNLGKINLVIYDNKVKNKLVDEIVDGSEIKNNMKKYFDIVFGVEELNIDTIKNSYGGWISPEKKIFLIPEFGHGDFLKYYENFLTYSEGFKKGYVRFVSENFPKEFSIEGFNENLLATFKLWKDIGLSAKYLIIDIPFSYTSEGKTVGGLQMVLETSNLDDRILTRILRDPDNYKKYYRTPIRESRKKRKAKQKCFEKISDL